MILKCETPQCNYNSNITIVIKNKAYNLCEKCAYLVSLSNNIPVTKNKNT